MKTTTYFASLLVFATLTANVMAAPSTSPYKKNSQAVVRDHRTSSQTDTSTPIVRDHRDLAPVVRDHRGTTPIVRDHRDLTPVVRDHRGDGPIVRDHRGEGPIVRDHRGDTPVLPPPVGPIKNPPFPGGIKPPVGPIGPIGPIGPVKDPPAPPKPPQDHHKPCFPWWQLGGGFFPGGYYPVGGCYPVGGVSTVFVQEPVVVAVPTSLPATVEAALPTLQPGMELTLKGADFGSREGQAVVKIGDLAIPAQIVKWQADAVTLRLPTVGIAKATAAQLVVICADGTLASETPFELATLATN